MNVDDMFSI